MREFMKKILLLAVSIAVVGNLWAQSKSEEKPRGHARIKFDQMVYDFGTTSMVQSLTGTFTFQNKGDGVLEVRKPATSCGCTVAAIKPERLEPGQKGELVFTLNVGDITRGHIEKQITVPCNDVAVPNVQLTVKVDLFSIYEVVPPQVSLGDLRLGTSTRQPVVLKRTDGQNLALGKTQTSINDLRVQVENLPDAAGKAAKLWIELAASGSPRRLSEQITVLAEDGTQVCVVPVFGRVVGDVSVSPEAMYWGVTDPDNWPSAFPELMSKRSLRVALAQANKPLEIKNVASSISDLELSVVTVETGRVFDVVARMTKAPKKSERGTITFETNVPSQPTVVVPVTISVLRPQSVAVPPNTPPPSKK
jgi:hypothetical protein